MSRLQKFMNEEKKEKAGLRETLIKLFTEKDPPKNGIVHATAKKLGIEPDEVENTIYSMFHMTLRGRMDLVGRHNDIDDSKFDAKQLKMGIEVEQEHVPDGLSEEAGNELAKRIAKDHLAENSIYYTHLKELEKTNDNPIKDKKKDE